MTESFADQVIELGMAERGGADQETSSLIATDFEATLLEVNKGWSLSRKLVVALVSVIIATAILEGVLFLAVARKAEAFSGEFGKVEKEFRDNFEQVQKPLGDRVIIHAANPYFEEELRKHFNIPDDSKTRSQAVGFVGFGGFADTLGSTIWLQSAMSIVLLLGLGTAAGLAIILVYINRVELLSASIPVTVHPPPWLGRELEKEFSTPWKEASERNHIIYPVHPIFPTSGAKEGTKLDIIFFHGIQFEDLGEEAWRTTWVQRDDPRICWPEQWLQEDFHGDLRVLFVEYDAYACVGPSHGGNSDKVADIGKNLLQSLVFSPTYKIGESNPIVLVGHNFGGIVIKSMVLEAHRARSRNASNRLDTHSVRKAHQFIDRLKGIIFYAVPHSGSLTIESFFTKSSQILVRFGIRRTAGIMSELEPFNRTMEELSMDFEEIVSKNRIIIYAFAEGKPTLGVGYIVEYAAATRLAYYQHYKLEDADHMSVCRPPKKTHESYTQLLVILRLLLVDQIEVVTSERERLSPASINESPFTQVGDYPLSELGSMSGPESVSGLD